VPWFDGNRGSRPVLAMRCCSAVAAEPVGGRNAATAGAIVGNRHHRHHVAVASRGRTHALAAHLRCASFRALVSSVSPIVAMLAIISGIGAPSGLFLLMFDDHRQCTAHTTTYKRVLGPLGRRRWPVRSVPKKSD